MESSKKAFVTQNPSNLKDLQDYAYESLQQISDKIDNLHKSRKIYQSTDLEFKKLFLNQIQTGMKANFEDLSRQMTLEMGKALKESKAELEKSIALIQHLSENAELYLQAESVSFDGKKFDIKKESIGVVFAVMPWNFPIWQVVRFLIPSLLLGNAVLLKPSDVVAGFTLKLQNIFNAAFVATIQQARPSTRDLIQSKMKSEFKNESDFKVVELSLVDHDTAGRIIAHPKISAVTFTGSTRGGQQIAEQSAQSLKKCVLELGGSDAYILLEDADVEWAAKSLTEGRLFNNGQSCISAKRIFVPQGLKKNFIDQILQQLKKHKMGDPLEADTTLGPLAHLKFRHSTVEQVKKMKEQASGGSHQVDIELQSDRGDAAFFKPQLWVHENQYIKFFRTEEIFAPVFNVFTYDSIDQAVDWVNDCEFGLGSGVFSPDLKKARQVAERLDAGMSMINDYIKSDVRVPFGGIKKSGYGRELGTFGFNELSNIRFYGWRPDSGS